MTPPPSPSSRRRAPPSSQQELLLRARALAGHSVAALAAALQVAVPRESRRAKGFVGQLAELALGADPEAGSRPDFPALGVELKTIPVGQAGRPTGSTFCCGIAMAEADRAEWQGARLRQRLARVLWLPVTDARLRPLAERRFGAAQLWSPSPAEAALLRADWEELMGWIGAGLGEALSARMGVALQVRPKAASARVRTLAPGPDGVQRVLPLGFYLRPSFTAGILGQSVGGSV